MNKDKFYRLVIYSLPLVAHESVDDEVLSQIIWFPMNTIIMTSNTIYNRLLYSILISKTVDSGFNGSL